MSKKIFTLIFSIIFIFTITMPYKVHATDVQGDALFNLLKAASNHHKKTAILDFLKIKFENNNELDDLKENLELYMEGAFGEDYEQSLEKKNVSMDDLRNNIDDLKKWDDQARMDLIKFVDDSKLEKAQQLIENNGKLKEEEPTPGGGGGGGALPPKEEPQEQKPVEEQKQEEQPLMKIQEPEKVECNFQDVEDHWAKDSIKHMVSVGIVRGITEDQFGPEEKVTRNQMATFIVKLLNIQPKEDEQLPFIDVNKDNWDYQFIKAAYDAKLVSGISAEQFDPNKLITREQMIVIVMNALQYKDGIAQETVQQDLSIYEDVSKVSDWALDSMKKAVSLGIMHGRTDQILDPQGVATRAEAIVIIEKVYNLIYK